MHRYIGAVEVLTKSVERYFKSTNEYVFITRPYFEKYLTIRAYETDGKYFQKVYTFVMIKGKVYFHYAKTELPFQCNKSEIYIGKS